MTARRPLRHPAARTLVAAGLTATLALAPGLALAASGANGWHWPAGTATGGMGGFGVWRRANRNYHLAQDIGVRVGSPVYALADGYVYDAYPKLAGYRPGGAMVVVYRTSDGGSFKALYGHITRLRFRKGQPVAAGDVLAYVARSSPRAHLHFGIHPGLDKPNDPRRNVFMGHSRKNGITYGWVDPIAFLNANTPWGTPSATATPSVGSSGTPGGSAGTP